MSWTLEMVFFPFWIVLESGEFWKDCLCLFGSIESPNYQMIGIPTHEIEMNQLSIPIVTELIQMIENEHLENVHNLKPIVNGKEISQILNRKAGAWLTECLRDEIEYQIANVNCSRDEIVAFISEWNK